MKKKIIAFLIIFVMAITLFYLHFYFYTNYIVLNKLNTKIILNHINEIFKQETETIEYLNEKRNNTSEEFADKIDQMLYDATLKTRLEAYNLELAIIEKFSNKYYKNKFPEDFEYLIKIKVIQETVIYQFYAFVVLITFLFLYVLKNYNNKDF